MPADVRRNGHRPDDSRFTPELMYSAASLYYLQDATQAEIAEQLGTSRATVSRLLAEARRVGIVRIDVVSPIVGNGTDLAARTAAALGLRSVRVAPYMVRTGTAAALAPAVSSALAEAHLSPGDTLLVSSGQTVYEAAQAHLPNLPGVVVAPTVGGLDEPEAWYQTNEIVRQVAVKVGGTPVFLYAPAQPGPDLRERLVRDHSTHRVLEHWRSARCALVGVGAPPPLRASLPSFVPAEAVRCAAGDVCTRFYDDDGAPVDYPGAERLLAIPLDVLRDIPVVIAVAVGQAKVRGIIAGARAGYFSELVTDIPTASALLVAVTDGPPTGHRAGRRPGDPR
jgi:DNA-binding transcriptional regulator LsrR (DeoR family)